MDKWDDSSRDFGGVNRGAWTEFEHAWMMPISSTDWAIAGRVTDPH